MTDKDLIEALGGIRPTARALGHRWPSLVQYWYENDRITKPEQREQIIDLVKTRAQCTGKASTFPQKIKNVVNGGAS
jgi:hypothetical protein